MFGVDLSPRLTASLLTVTMVLAGGLFVVRRRRREDRSMTRSRSCDCLDQNAIEVFSTSKDNMKNSVYLLVTDFTSGKLDGNIHLLVDKLSKKQITNQEADRMMDVINKNNKNNKRNRKTKRDEKEEEFEKERKLKVVIQELEEENKRLKENVTDLQLRNDSWEEQIRILHVQLAAVSKYAGKLRHILETSKFASQKVDSLLNNSKMFQSQIITHYDGQKINATLN